jgi:hypothetical protein
MEQEMLEFFKKFKFRKKNIFPKVGVYNLKMIDWTNERRALISKVLESMEQIPLSIVNEMSKNSHKVLADSCYETACTFLYKDVVLSLSKNYISIFKNGELVFSKSYQYVVCDFSFYLASKSTKELWEESGK